MALVPEVEICPISTVGISCPSAGQGVKVPAGDAAKDGTQVRCHEESQILNNCILHHQRLRCV